MSLRWIVGAVCAALSAGPAIGGGWPKEPGDGQAIFTFIFDAAEESFDQDGDTISGPDFEKTELSVYFEHGLTERLTFVAKPVLQYVRIEEELSTDEAFGFGSSELGLRWLALRPRPGAVASVQTSLLIPGEAENATIEPLGEGGYGAEVRGFLGQGWSHGFVELQAAWRDRADADSGEARLDLTLGARPHDRVLLLAQSFSSWGLEDRGPIDARYQSHKLQLSAVADLSERYSIQAGAFTTVAGRDVVQENAGLVALWVRY